MHVISESQAQAINSRYWWWPIINGQTNLSICKKEKILMLKNSKYFSNTVYIPLFWKILKETCIKTIHKLAYSALQNWCRMTYLVE